MEEKRELFDLRATRSWYEDYFGEHGTWPTSAAYANVLVRFSGLDALSDGRRARLLDVACGGGYFLSHLAAGAFDRIGLDLSATAAAEAHRRSGGTVAVGAAEALPIRDRSVDAIACLGAFEHFVDKDAACREWLRVIRPGGTLIVLVPCDRAWIDNDVQPIELVGTIAEWDEFFTARGFVVEATAPTDAYPDLAAASAHCVVLRLRPVDASRPFLTGPLASEELQMLLEVVDQRLERDAITDDRTVAAVAEPPVPALSLPRAPALEDPTGLTGLTAPFFQAERGRRRARIARRLLNLPLRVFGKPQLYFNEAVRRLLVSWAETLRTALDAEAGLRRAATTARMRLDHLERTWTETQHMLRELPVRTDALNGRVGGVEQWLAGMDTRLTHDEAWLRSTASEIPKLWEAVQRFRLDALSALRFESGTGGDGGSIREPDVPDVEQYARLVATMPDGVLVNLGCGDRRLGGYINVDARPGVGADVIADVRRLPFEPGTVREIASAHLVEHFARYELAHRILPYWRSLLRPGGLLRVVCPDWEGTLARYAQGGLDLERLHAITFGDQEYVGNDHRAMYTPATLRAVLEAAGFEDATVIARDRDNQGCPEMEVTARRPLV